MSAKNGNSKDRTHENEVTDALQDIIERLYMDIWCLSECGGLLRFLYQAREAGVEHEKYFSDAFLDEIVPALMREKSGEAMDLFNDLLKAVGQDSFTFRPHETRAQFEPGNIYLMSEGIREAILARSLQQWEIEP